VGLTIAFKDKAFKNHLCCELRGQFLFWSRCQSGCRGRLLQGPISLGLQEQRAPSISGKQQSRHLSKDSICPSSEVTALCLTEVTALFFFCPVPEAGSGYDLGIELWLFGKKIRADCW